MTKKETEEACLKRVLSNIPRKGTIGYEIDTLIKLVKFYPKERPDFIGVNNNLIIGLEHCLVDSLYNEYGDSFYRKENSNIQKIVQDYAEHNDLDKGTESMKKIIMDKFAALERYNYDQFIHKFEDVCNDHNTKCIESKPNADSYRDKINSYNKEKSYLICLVEIPLSNVIREYDVTENGKIHMQKLNNIPFTKDMINVINAMRNFDYVVICSYTNKHTGIIYFDVNNIGKSIKEQNIKLYDAFSLHQDFHVDNLEIEKGDGEYSFIFKGHK